MEIFEQAADGEFGAIVILIIAGLFVLRFILKLLKFVIVQFPALAGGLIFGLVFAAEDGVDVDLVLENPVLWEQLLPYVLPALAVGFVIWNVILSILKSVFRSILKAASNETQQPASHQRAKVRQVQARDEDEIVTASEVSAMKTRKRHMDEYEARNKRIHEHELSHRDKNANQPIVLRRVKANRTVTRRVST